MTAKASSIPDEILFHFVTKPQSIDALFNSLYDQPDEFTRQHFMTVNSHLEQNARPGQMVILTPPNADQCTLFEADLMEAARRIDRQLAAQSEAEAKAMVEQYSLLSNVAAYSGAGYGVAMNYFKQHKTQVEHILREIKKLHVKTYNRYGKFNTKEFFRHRKLLFNRLDNVLKTMVGRGAMGLNIDRKNIKRSLGLSTKSLLHQLKKHPVPISDLPGFEKNHVKVRQYSKVLKGAGYVALGLDGLQSVAEVKKVCTTGREKECARSKFSEGGRLIGSVGGGGLGGRLAAHAACTIVFALPSGGSSFLWCGIVAGAVGGLAGAKLFGSGGEAVGELIYETTIRN